VGGNGLACDGGFSYTPGMKTAISLPNRLFESADAFAVKTGRSRSDVYAEALREFLARHDEDRITEQLDALCADLDTGLPPERARAARRLLERSEW
jgi:predicted transcriptional regulator